MGSDVDAVIRQVCEAFPSVVVRRLAVTHPADDDGLWDFRLPGSDGRVSIESADGSCPFLVESDLDDDAETTASVAATVAKVVAQLRRSART